MGEIDTVMERRIMEKVTSRALQTVCVECDGKLDTQMEREMVEAYSRSGGYVNYLRENAGDLISRIKVSDEADALCRDLAVFTAHFRARPSKVQDEQEGERELGSRLASQYTRLMKCLAVVLNRDSADEVVMDRVRRVAVDTARGVTLDIATELYNTSGGMDLPDIATKVCYQWGKLEALVRFLRGIKVIKAVSHAKLRGLKYTLTDEVRALYEKGMKGD